MHRISMPGSPSKSSEIITSRHRTDVMALSNAVTRLSVCPITLAQKTVHMVTMDTGGTESYAESRTNGQRNASRSGGNAIQSEKNRS